MLPHYLCPLHAKSDICCHTLCYLNDICKIYQFEIAGLLSIVAVISAQYFMTSHSEIIWGFVCCHFLYDDGTFCQVCTILFCKTTDHFTANLGANMIGHVSEMGLYIIWTTLEKFESWNQTLLITKYKHVKWCQMEGHPQ